MRKALPAGLISDRKGMLIATLCFIHCVAGPVLLTVAGLASLAPVSERIEPIFVLSSAVLGSATLIPAYRKKHGRLSCLALFAGGLLFLLLRKHMELGILKEGLATGIGAALIVGAHALNVRFSRRCPCCDYEGESARELSGSPGGIDAHSGPMHRAAEIKSDV